ncbi:MAG: zinc ABC transporter substrate-binding protein [Candidatus Thalassarchaeaceae archaeon]|nr:zinc ABC transporter substrate-binding protein [Candidatus Thalassarchaeaceae archaeon]
MNNTVRALSVSLILVLSSLAGCLSDDTEISDKNIEIESYGTVMVSTYHVGELVSAVAGDRVTIEFMSQENIPVHDYEPSASDLIRLQQADLFFYHGLNLEPWVESTLSSLGDDAPPSYMTHAMPTGEATLDYESILVSDLCELMSDGPFESTTLGMMSVDEHDDHDDHGDDDDHSDDDDHDDHGDDDDHSDDDEHDDHGDDDHSDDDDHDDHGDDDDHSDDDDHDDHDDHDGHEHAGAEKIIENPEACPADTTVQVFHMEAGEHVLEFESEHDEDFNMAALKMLGGHANHDHDDHGDDDHDDHSDDNHTDDDHGDDDHDDEKCHNTETHENYESTEEDCEAAGHVWADDEDHGEEMCHNTETHEDYESTEEECESAGHTWMEHEDHNLSEIHADRVAHTLSFPEDDHDDHGDDDHGDDDDHSEEEGHHEVGAVVIHIEVEGDYGFALPNDVELFVLMGEGGHDDHDDHSDEGDDHDDEGGEIHADDDEVFNYDPHSWLSPLAFEAQVNVVLEKLMMTFPDGNTVFTANAEAYNLQLDALDDSFNAAFGEDGACAGQEKTIVANHNAYSYMSVQYDIEIVSLHGLDPEGEPSPQDIADVVEHINEEGITVLFVEEYTDQTAVDSIVQETGVTIEILYTMEMSPSDANDDYMSMMNKNLDNLVDGIGC